MTRNFSDLKMVVLDSAYDIWDSPGVQSLFGKLISLKLRGYRAEYPDGVLPADATDFVGTHFVVCKEDENGLIPISALKNVGMRCCERHIINFPLFDFIHHESFTPHRAVLRSLIDEARSRGKDILYSGSWTAEPDLRHDRETGRALREMLFSMHYFAYSELVPSELVGGGVMRFGAHETLKKVGWLPFADHGTELPPVQISHLSDEQVLLLHLERFSDEFRFRAQKWRGHWESRISFAPASASGLQKRRAA